MGERGGGKGKRGEERGVAVRKLSGRGKGRGGGSGGAGHACQLPRGDEEDQSTPRFTAPSLYLHSPHGARPQIERLREELRFRVVSAHGDPRAVLAAISAACPPSGPDSAPAPAPAPTSAALLAAAAPPSSSAHRLADAGSGSGEFLHSLGSALGASAPTGSASAGRSGSRNDGAGGASGDDCARSGHGRGEGDCASEDEGGRRGDDPVDAKGAAGRDRTSGGGDEAGRAARGAGSKPCGADHFFEERASTSLKPRLPAPGSPRGAAGVVGAPALLPSSISLPSPASPHSSSSAAPSISASTLASASFGRRAPSQRPPPLWLGSSLEGADASLLLAGPPPSSSMSPSHRGASGGGRLHRRHHCTRTTSTDASQPRAGLHSSRQDTHVHPHVETPASASLVLPGSRCRAPPPLPAPPPPQESTPAGRYAALAPAEPAYDPLAAAAVLAKAAKLHTADLPAAPAAPRFFDFTAASIATPTRPSPLPPSRPTTPPASSSSLRHTPVPGQGAYLNTGYTDASGCLPIGVPRSTGPSTATTHAYRASPPLSLRGPSAQPYSPLPFSGASFPAAAAAMADSSASVVVRPSFSSATSFSPPSLDAPHSPPAVTAVGDVPPDSSSSLIAQMIVAPSTDSARWLPLPTAMPPTAGHGSGMRSEFSFSGSAAPTSAAAASAAPARDTDDVLAVQEASRYARPASTVSSSDSPALSFYERVLVPALRARHATLASTSADTRTTAGSMRAGQFAAVTQTSATATSALAVLAAAAKLSATASSTNAAAAVTDIPSATYPSAKPTSAPASDALDESSHATRTNATALAFSATAVAPPLGMSAHPSAPASAATSGAAVARCSSAPWTAPAAGTRSRGPPLLGSLPARGTWSAPPPAPLLGLATPAGDVADADPSARSAARRLGMESAIAAPPRFAVATTYRERVLSAPPRSLTTIATTTPLATASTTATEAYIDAVGVVTQTADTPSSKGACGYVDGSMDSARRPQCSNTPPTPTERSETAPQVALQPVGDGETTSLGKPGGTWVSLEDAYTVACPPAQAMDEGLADGSSRATAAAPLSNSSGGCPARASPRDSSRSGPAATNSSYVADDEGATSFDVPPPLPPSPPPDGDGSAHDNNLGGGIVEAVGGDPSDGSSIEAPSATDSHVRPREPDVSGAAGVGSASESATGARGAAVSDETGEMKDMAAVGGDARSGEAMPDEAGNDAGTAADMAARASGGGACNSSGTAASGYGDKAGPSLGGHADLPAPSPLPQSPLSGNPPLCSRDIDSSGPVSGSGSNAATTLVGKQRADPPNDLGSPHDAASAAGVACASSFLPTSPPLSATIPGENGDAGLNSPSDVTRGAAGDTESKAAALCPDSPTPARAERRHDSDAGSDSEHDRERVNRSLSPFSGDEDAGGGGGSSGDGGAGRMEGEVGADRGAGDLLAELSDASISVGAMKDSRDDGDNGGGDGGSGREDGTEKPVS